MSQKYVGKQLLWLSSLHGLHPENIPLCSISWIYTMSPSLTATNIKPTVSDGLRYILQPFYEPGEGAWNQNHLSWTGLCFENVKNPELKSAGPNCPDLWERESRNLFFQGQPVLMNKMALPWPASLAPSPVAGKRNDIMCSKETKIVLIERSFI